MPLDTAATAYLLRHGDDNLIESQRLCEWVARAPRIEDDVALLNIALDHLGHARELLTAAGDREGRGRSEDDLAYGRNELEFSNAILFEMPNGDFGRTVARILTVAAWQSTLYRSWVGSGFVELAEFGPRGVREAAYHLEYGRTWAERLALGTEESADRLRAGFDSVLPHVGELFVDDTVTDRLGAEGWVTPPSTLEDECIELLTSCLGPLGLSVEPVATPVQTPGRLGHHTEAFSPMLAELQYVRRAFPGGSW